MSPGRPDPPQLIALAGLPGTGKSTLARALASRRGAVVLDKDRVRALLLGDAVEYSREQDDRVFRGLLEAAALLARAGRARWVVLDGRCFTRRADVEAVRAFAARCGLPLLFVECACTREAALARLARDAARGTHPAANRGPALYERLAAEREPIPEPKLVLSTDDAPPEVLAAAVLAACGPGPPPGGEG